MSVSSLTIQTLARPSKALDRRTPRLVSPRAPESRVVGVSRSRKSTLHVLRAAESLGPLPKASWFKLDRSDDRKARLLELFGGPIDRARYERLLADDLKVQDANATYGKQEFCDLFCGQVAPAFPDFTFTAATDGEVDKAGAAIVEVQVSAHHTGAAYTLPGMPPVPASGRRVVLKPQHLKVRLSPDGRVASIQAMSPQGFGPAALYRAVAGA